LTRLKANPDLPNDVPSEWASKNLQSGEAGGQGEVRIVYYKNNLEQLAAIKIYSVAAKIKKNNQDLETFYKERRMRAHRELTALKRLQGKICSCFQPIDHSHSDCTLLGVQNVSQLTSYSSDFTNIPNSEEDAVVEKKLYWIIMEYINGCTLEDFVHAIGEIDLLNAVKLTRKLLLTIKKVHARGVVHRDIKPINLLVRYGVNAPIESAEIYVIDFGLSYIENREDNVDLTSFEEKQKYERTYFGDTIGNCFFRVPQLNSASTKQMTAKQKNVLLDVRRSPTIDASSICAILFWLITNIEPGLKTRDQYNLAPHQDQRAENQIMNKIEEAANRSGMCKLVRVEYVLYIIYMHLV
jgi:serine/threonine protein kinase